MKILTVLMGFLLGAAVFAPEISAQYRQEQARREAEELNRRNRETREKFDMLRREQSRLPGSRRENQSPGGRPATFSPFPAQPSQVDWLLAAPDAEDRALYAEFLRQPGTGLIRLLSDQGCQEDTRLLLASEFCIKYQSLYGASVYSFRINNYMPERFGDIVYKNDTLHTIGKMTLGFLTDLGKDVELKDVSTQTAGAKYVFDFAPPETSSLIESAFRSFQEGVEAGGFKYQRSYRLEENHRYLLRSVAYQNNKKNKKSSAANDDLLSDERKDVVIAFQVVRISGAKDGGVTLLWRELQRKNTAKVAMDKK
jgi:hypothetical protein